ncbi:MAG: exopolysaccharide biosynthesis protein [Luteimonas sp.]
MATDTPAHSPGPADRAGAQRNAGTRALLAALATGDPDDTIRFRDVFAGLGERAFGMLLFIATLPAFIPIPGVGGAVSGPLAILIGVQLLIGLRMPWLPGFIARRGPHRHAVARFEKMLSPWLGRLERLVKPRLAALLDHRIASMFSGLLLVLLGVLLALPIPLTNYLFGALLLLFALALLERDGALMIAAWIIGAIAVAVFGILSGTLATVATEWIARLF